MTAPLRAPVEVQFKATGVEQVRNGLKLVARDGEQSLNKIGSSSRQIAGGLEAIARQGKVTGEAMKQILSSGAEMAFMFGAGGAIVGALAITGMAIYEHITGRMKEARDEINKTRTEIEGLDLGSAAKRQQHLYSGNPNALRQEGESDAAFRARSQGLEGVRRRIEELRPLARSGVLKLIEQGSHLGGRSKDEQELQDLVEVLAKVKREYNELAPVTLRLAKAQGELDKTGLSLAQDKAQEELDKRIDKIDIGHVLLEGLPISTSQRYHNESPIGAFSTTGIHAIAAEIKQRAPTIREELAMSFQTDVVAPLAESIQQGITETIGNSIKAGFAAAFEKGANIGKVAAAFGGAALQTIGGVFEQIGTQTLIGLKFMETIKNAILSWNPALGIGAAIGLIALGAALQGAGGRMTSNASGGGGGGGGSSAGAPTIIDRGLINPSMGSSASSITPQRPVSVTIIGQRDPTLQRELREVLGLSDSRGTL